MNQQILSQDEVDALLQGITGESQKLEEEEQPQGGIRDYDLASQERIVRGRMPTMEVINERFARNIRIGLFNLMRKSPEVSIGGIKVQKFSAFLREIVVPTNFNIVSVKPLRGSGLIVCDPTLVFAVIDALFGGAGKFHTRIEGRDFSPTEQRVILRLLQTIMAEYRKSWLGIYPLELEFQRAEMQPHLKTDKRLLALPQVQGDLSRVKLDPRRRRAWRSPEGSRLTARRRRRAHERRDRHGSVQLCTRPRCARHVRDGEGTHAGTVPAGVSRRAKNAGMARARRSEPLR